MEGGKKKIEELVLTLLSSTGSNPKGNCLSLWLKLGKADSVADLCIAQ